MSTDTSAPTPYPPVGGPAKHDRELTPRSAAEEIWETTTDGTVFYTVTDLNGRAQERHVGGKSGTKLRISTTDRVLNQEACYLGNDIFVNGMLVRVDNRVQPGDNSPDAMRTEDLMKGFAKNGMAFRSYVDSLNELNVRRMRELAQATEGTVSVAQVAYLDQVVKEKYVKHGDTPTYRAMKAGPTE